MKRFFQYLHTKPATAVSYFVLIVAVISINTWQLVLPNFGSDDSYSIAAAKNLDDGHGYTIATVSEHDLSMTYYDPLNKWPPGYSLLLVIIKRITKTEWITACYILNAIGATFLILALRKIFYLLQIPERITNIYLLFAGFFPYSFLSWWFSDLIAVSCFMWAIVLLIQMTIKNKYLILSVSGAGLLLGFCAWLKYLYLPIGPVPFIFLLFYSWKTSQVKLSKALLTGMIIVVVSAAFELWFQHYHTGTLFYINPTKEGFFPRNLLHPGPIIPGSLLHLDLWTVQLSEKLHIPYSNFFFIWKCLNVILTAGLLVLIYRYYRNNGFQVAQPLHIYMNLGMVIAISISVLLGFLSVTQAPYSSHSTPFWTYIEEIRYYGVLSIFIQQGLFFLILYQGDLLGRFKKYFILSATAVIALVILHGFYYLSKKALIQKEIGKTRKTEQFDFIVLKTVDDLIENGNKLVVCSYVDEDANFASLSGASGLYNIKKINGELRTSKAITLLVILNKSMLPEFNTFFLKYKPTLLFNCTAWTGDGNTNDFYILKLP
ncbi:MAG TPA: hypothetical protein VK772_08570 [Puia sp.]|nr:hypothetical protein [Puia sp.]